MRKPTSKEKMILRNCLEGLVGDVEAIVSEGPSYDVHGTFKVNLEVMLGILKKLENESEF